MNFFKDAFDKLDEIGQEVGKHAGYAVADITRALESAGQDVSKHIDPSTLKAIEEFGKEAGSYVGATADDIWKALLGAGEDAGKQIQPIIREIGKSLGEGGEGVRDYFLGVIADASMIEWADMPAHIQQWIAEHPERIIGIILGILAGPLATAAVPLVLGAFGFTAGGIAAGSIAAGIQSGIGDVAAHSLFATLMSAGAGGAGLVAVQSMVGTLAGMAGMAGVAVPALVGMTSEAEKDVDGSEL